MSEGTLCFVKYKHFDFKNPNLRTRLSDENGELQITVSAENYAKFIRLDLTETDAVFSDNYFDLMGGEEKTITIKRADKPLDLKALESQLTVSSLFDTYE